MQQRVLPWWRVYIVRYLCALGVCCVLAHCGSAGTSSGSSTPLTGSVDTALAGEWRILSENIYFDNGLTSTVTPVTTPVTLDAAGTWTFGSSSGSWTVDTITDSDWTGWAIASYGPTRKLMLDNWNSTTEQGPIDETGATIDFIWIVYATTSETNGAGTVWMKLYRP